MGFPLLRLLLAVSHSAPSIVISLLLLISHSVSAMPIPPIPIQVPIPTIPNVPTVPGIPSIPTDPSLPPVTPPTFEFPVFDIPCSDLGSTDPECASLPVQLPCIELAGQQASCLDITDPTQRVFDLNINQFRSITQLTNTCSNQAVTGDILLVCQQLNGFDANNPADAANLNALLNGVLPEEAFSINNTIVYSSNYQITEVESRLQSVRSRESKVDRRGVNRSVSRTLSDGGITDPAGLLASGGSAGVSNLDDTETGFSSGLVSRWGGFANASISDGEIDGAQFEQNADLSASNITAGFDYRLTDFIVLGSGIGFASNKTDFTGTVGGAESNGANFTAFATLFSAGSGYLDLVLDIGVNSHSLERSISITGDAEGDQSGNRVQAFGETDSTLYSFALGGGKDFSFSQWNLGGFFRLLFTSATIDAYEESTDSSAAGSSLIYAFGEQSIRSNRLSLGARLSRTFSTRLGVFIPEVRLEFEAENEETKDELAATLLSTNDSLVFQGSKRDSSYATIGAGLSTVLRGGTSAFIFYESRQQHDFVDQSWISLGLKIEL